MMDVGKRIIDANYLPNVNFSSTNPAYLSNIKKYRERTLTEIHRTQAKYIPKLSPWMVRPSVRPGLIVADILTVLYCVPADNVQNHPSAQGCVRAPDEHHHESLDCVPTTGGLVVGLCNQVNS